MTRAVSLSFPSSAPTRSAKRGIEALISAALTAVESESPLR